MEPITTAVIIGIATVVGLIVTIIQQASQVSRDVIRAKYGKEVDAVARKLTPLINKNESLRTQISTALQNHNSKLASNLLMASPLSSAIEPLRNNIKANEKGIADSEKYFDEQRVISDRADKDVTNLTNAFNSDLASATEAKHAWLGEAGDSIKSDTAKLEANQQELINKLQAAKNQRMQNAIPSNSAAQPNSNANIGVMDRTGKSSIPTMQMKGNN